MSKFFKTVSMMLSLLLVLGTTGIGAGAYLAPDVSQEHKHAEAIETLGALGIMVGDADTGLFRPDEEIKRSEVAKIAVTTLGLASAAESSNYPTKFPDVARDHWGNGYINVAVNQGLIIGDDNGNFRPDDTISYAEAMTILVRLIGHEPAALSKGGYPAGFLATGTDNDLSYNAKAGSNDPASRGLVAQMTFNALTAKMMEQTSFGDDPQYSIVDKTLLESKLKTEKLKGQVTATSQTSLSATSSLKKDQVKIGEDVYTTKVDAVNLIGYNVVFYLQRDADGDKEIILIRPEASKNDSLTISADNFEYIKDGEGKKVVGYWIDKENDKKVTEKNVVSEPKLIYNGKAETYSDELANIKDSAGNITLLDTDRDGKYDIIFVTEYFNIVVEEVIATSGKIVDKYNAPTLTLDPEDEDLDVVIEKAGEKTPLSELKEWDVLSVAQSKDKSIYRIVVVNNAVEGKVVEIDSEGRVIIGGEAYKIASNYPNSIELEEEGTFFLDAEGKIAAVDTTQKISGNYAYVVNAAMTQGVDTRLEIRLFTKDGATKVYNAAEKVRFNGAGNKKPAEVLDLLKADGKVVNQLITFEVNSDGEIVKISTAADKTATGAIDEDNFTMNLKLEGAVYKSATGKVGNVNVDENTIVFDIPSEWTDTEDFAIRNKSMFENETPYDVIVFDMTEDYTAKAMIVTNTNYQANADSDAIVVTSVSSTRNDQGIVVDKLYGMQAGKEVELLADAQGTLVKPAGETTAKLAKGDIVQVKTNAKNEVSAVRVLFDIAAKNTEFTSSPAEDLEILYGKVTGKFSGSMNLSVKGAESNIAFGDATVYYVDSVKANSAVKVTTSADISKYDETNPEMVFVRMYKDVVEEIVIIKL